MITPYSGGKLSSRNRQPSPMFVVVLGSFLGLQFVGRVAEEEEEQEQRGEIIDAVVPVNEDGRPIFKYHPPNPAERRDLVRDDIGQKLLEFMQADKLLDGPSADDPDVLKYLIDQALWNIEVTRLSEFHYSLLDEQAVLFEPGPHRGAFVSAFGQVVAVEEPIPFAGQVDSVENLYGVLFRNAEGVLYHVISTVPIDRKPGDWIQVYGLFYRLRTVTVQKDGVDAQEPSIDLVLVKDKEVFKAYPPIEVTELNPEGENWTSLIHELTYDEANETDERPFWLTLNYVKGLGKKGYEELREKPEFEIFHFGRLAKPILAEKEKYRFKFVSMRGSIVRDWVDMLKSDNPGKIDRMDSGFLLQPTEYLVFLVSPRPWSEYDVKIGSEYVQVEGIFYKRWTYIPEKGPPAREIPLVIVTGVYPVDPEPDSLMVAVQILLVGVGLMVVVVFVVMALKDRKKVGDFRAEYRSGKRERSSKREGASSEEQ
jgi:hypothetical protein